MVILGLNESQYNILQPWEPSLQPLRAAIPFKTIQRNSTGFSWTEELSPVLKFTGVQFDRNRTDGTITIHMERYIEQLCEEYKGQFTPQAIPYSESEKERK